MFDMNAHRFYAQGNPYNTHLGAPLPAVNDERLATLLSMGQVGTPPDPNIGTRLIRTNQALYYSTASSCQACEAIFACSIVGSLEGGLVSLLDAPPECQHVIRCFPSCTTKF